MRNEGRTLGGIVNGAFPELKADGRGLGGFLKNEPTDLADRTQILLILRGILG
jgi:hypothetical protein